MYTTLLVLASVFALLAVAKFFLSGRSAWVETTFLFVIAMNLERMGKKAASHICCIAGAVTLGLSVYLFVHS